MSADNFSTLWVQDAVNQNAINRAAQLIQETGRALPCKVTAVNGSLVTVALQVQGPWTLPPLVIPKAESQWLRNPTQVGDVGLTVPADVFLGGISGQGSGVPDLQTQYANLSALVFLPIAATSFGATPNPNKAWVNGPNGAIMSDTAQTALVKIAPNQVMLVVGANSVILNSSGLTIDIGGKTWTFTASGFTDSSGVVEETHVHGGVSTGSGETLGPQHP